MDKEFKNIPVRDARDRDLPQYREGGRTAAWQRKEGKDPKGGLNRKGVGEKIQGQSYRLQ